MSMHLYTRSLPAGEPAMQEKASVIHEKALVSQKFSANEFYVYRRPPLSGARMDLTDGYDFRVWTPGRFGLFAPEMGKAGVLWSAFHLAGVFRTREYSVLYIEHNGVIVHRSCILPASYRCPFMDKDDIQVSSTFTVPEFQNRGLARAALRKILSGAGPRCRNIWYISRISNVPSIAVCTSEGFRLWGIAARTAPLGVRAFGRFQVARPASERFGARQDDN